MRNIVSFMAADTRHATTLEYALLGLLDQGPQSGYDLCRTFATTPFALYSDSPGAVYPAIRRLEARRWIEAPARSPTGGRRRRELRLSAAGRVAFGEWLAREPTRDEVTHDMGALYMRFAFMSQAAPPDVPRRFLATLGRLLEQHLADLERYAAETSGHMPPTGQLVFEHGREAVRHTLNWCARAARRLGKTDRSHRSRNRRSS
jgi:DNA-binding PadR family transcriptional regulator